MSDPSTEEIRERSEVSPPSSGGHDQALTISDNNFILSQLRIIIYDRFGYLLNNGNLEYSFTLAIEYEI